MIYFFVCTLFIWCVPKSCPDLNYVLTKCLIWGDKELQKQWKRLLLGTVENTLGGKSLAEVSQWRALKSILNWFLIKLMDWCKGQGNFLAAFHTGEIKWAWDCRSHGEGWYKNSSVSDMGGRDKWGLRGWAYKHVAVKWHALFSHKCLCRYSYFTINGK